MSVEEPNKNNTNNSAEDNDDRSDSDEYSEENSSNHPRMDQEKREYYLSKLFNEEQSDRFDKYKESSIEHDKKNRSLQKLECPRIKKVVQNLIGDVQIGNLVQIVLNGSFIVEMAKPIISRLKNLYSYLGLCSNEMKKLYDPETN